MKAVLLLAPEAGPEPTLAELRRRGADAEMLEGRGQRALLVTGDVSLEDLPGVEDVLQAATPHPRVQRAPSRLQIGSIQLGGPLPILMAGPCAVEDEATLEVAAAAAAAAGAQVLRGGAFKPRTSPYAFQGAGAAGLRWLRDAADRHGLGVVTEALDVRHVELVAGYADLIQIGSRNMYNQPLLREAGRASTPLLLKRGASATLTEWLLAAECALDAGAPGVALCERGVRTFNDHTRNTLDLGTVAWLLEHTDLPVVVDPSHGAGRRELISRLALASVALGAHGLLIEMHPDPGRARSDAAQALTPSDLARLARTMWTNCGKKTEPQPHSVR